MNTLQPLIDALLAENTLELSIISWRQFINAAKRSGNRDTLNDLRIELKCRYRRRRSPITVQSEKHPIEDLDSLEFTLECREAKKTFIEFEAANMDSDVGKDAVGILMYNAPIAAEGLAGLPTSVIENALVGSVSGWIFYGENSLRDISRSLSAQRMYDVALWLTIPATSSGKPHTLAANLENPHRTTFHWAADRNPLELAEARFVVAPRRRPSAE